MLTPEKMQIREKQNSKKMTDGSAPPQYPSKVREGISLPSLPLKSLAAPNL